MNAERRDPGSRPGSLRGDEARFRLTFERAAVGIAHVATRWRFMEVNQRLCDIVGWSRDELLARTFPDITHPDDRAASLDLSDRLLAGEIPAFELEKRYVRKDGSTVWANLNVSLVRDRDGRPSHFVAIVEDISRRKEAEEELARRAAETALVSERVRELATSLELSVILRGALRSAMELMEVEGGRVCLADGERFEEGDAPPVAEPSAKAPPPGACGCGDLVRAGGEPRVLASGPRPGGEVGGAPAFVFHALFPLEVRGDPIGALCVFSRTALRAAPRRIELVRDLCGPLALAIENARLFRAERAAREQAEGTRTQLTRVFERVTDAFVALDREWRYVYVNPRAGELLGRAPGELLGKHIWTEFPDGVGQPFHLAYERALREQRPVRMEDHYAPWDRWFENVIYPSPDGLSIYFHDVSDRRRAEEALRRSEAALAEAQRVAKVGSFSRDLATGKTTYSAEMRRLLGFDSAGMPPEGEARLEALVHPDDGARVAEAMRRVEAGEGVVFEARGRPEGGERYLQGRFEPVRGAEGTITGLVGTLQDVTERVLAENEIRALAESLEARVAERTRELRAVNQELEAFSYSVSHDLRAPLRAIDGFTRILVEEHGERLDEEGRRLGNVVRRNTQRMAQLIEDLLALARLGRADVRRQPVDMADLARSVFQEILPREERARVDFRVGDLPEASGDPSLLRQVLANLIANAVKFSSRKPTAVVEVGGEAREGENAYWVRDEGAGFDMRYAGKLFGVFQRLHGNREYEGSGVGLAIVQRIVQRHGGRVFAEGAPDRGATVGFTLPAGRPP